MATKLSADFINVLVQPTIDNICAKRQCEGASTANMSESTNNIFTILFLYTGALYFSWRAFSELAFLFKT
jgi:hypothetical protein